MGGFTGGGLGAFTAAKIKNTSIPARLPCSVCKKTKDKNQFSNKQLEAARFKIVKQNANLPQGRRTDVLPAVRCRECVGQVNQEMECMLCGSTKDLNEFSKTHRKNPDRAKCIECMESTLAVEPNDHAAVIGRYSDSDDDDDDDFDGRSQTTGITNPWQMDWDGDFVTSDRDSSRATSQAGGSVTGGPGRAPPRPAKASGLSNLTAANVDAFNSRTGTDTTPKTDSQLTDALLDMSVQDSIQEEQAHNADDDIASTLSAKPGNIGAWKTYSSAAHQAPAKPQGQGQAFRAYGPAGQSAVHHRAPSSTSGATDGDGWQTATRQTPRSQRPKPVASSRTGNFARVRPDNKKTVEEKAKGKGVGPWAAPSTKDDDDDDDDGEGW